MHPLPSLGLPLCPPASPGAGQGGRQGPAWGAGLRAGLLKDVCQQQQQRVDPTGARFARLAGGVPSGTRTGQIGVGAAAQAVTHSPKPADGGLENCS